MSELPEKDISNVVIHCTVGTVVFYNKLSWFVCRYYSTISCILYLRLVDGVVEGIVVLQSNNSND